MKLCDLVSLVKAKLEQDGVIVREIRLNGSGASSVTTLPQHCQYYFLKQLLRQLWNSHHQQTGSSPFSSPHPTPPHNPFKKATQQCRLVAVSLDISNRCNFFLCLCLTSHSFFLLFLFSAFSILCADNLYKDNLCFFVSSQSNILSTSS